LIFSSSKDKDFLEEVKKYRRQENVSYQEINQEEKEVFEKENVLISEMRSPGSQAMEQN
jgi:hypothetical protein